MFRTVYIKMFDITIILWNTAITSILARLTKHNKGNKMTEYKDDFPPISDEDIKKQKTLELIRHIDFLKTAVAKYLVDKEKSEIQLRDLLGHDKNHQGRIAYPCDQYTIRITTGWIWSFKEEEYKLMKTHIPECFDPVREVTKYKLDEKICRNIETYASKEEKAFLDKIFSKKESKMNVIIDEKRR